MTNDTRQSPLVEDLRRLTASELSLTARRGYLGLLLAATVMTVIVTALLVTEPSLPWRASIALGVLAAIGLSWVGFAVWVLSYRRILLGRDRLVAGRMAVGFSIVFCLGAVVVGFATASRSAFAAAAMGALMIVIAAGLLVQARRRVEQLSKRRDELEQQLGRRYQ